MIIADLEKRLRELTARVFELSEEIAHEKNKNVKNDPRVVTLITPLGMFAGTAIDTLELKETPRVVYVGDRRLGGVDYSSVRMTLPEPFDYDPLQWDHVGSNTFVWSD